MEIFVLVISNYGADHINLRLQNVFKFEILSFYITFHLKYDSKIMSNHDNIIYHIRHDFSYFTETMLNRSVTSTFTGFNSFFTKQFKTQLCISCFTIQNANQSIA